jgi:hypothetical protein
MKTESIAILKKVQVPKSAAESASGCCGGTPVSNEEACCKLDEDKKAEGAVGCGCNSSTAKITSTGCC